MAYPFPLTFPIRPKEVHTLGAISSISTIRVMYPIWTGRQSSPLPDYNVSVPDTLVMPYLLLHMDLRTRTHQPVYFRHRLLLVHMKPV